MDLPVSHPLRPMLAKNVDGIDGVPGADIVFEPKWDGFRCIVFRDGDEIILGSRNERPLTRYFPEMLDPLRAMLPDRCVIDGELIVAIDEKLEFDALQQRIHPAASRVNMLAEQTPASFVAFDVLALDDRDLRQQPFSARRAALESIGERFTAPIYLTRATDDPAVAHDWFVRFEGAGLDGLIAKPAEGTYVEDRRVQYKVKHVRTADAVVAGYRVHKDGEGVGSLLLGLYDEAGTLHHVGVAASFTAKRRREFLDELAAYRLEDFGDHPWAAWLEAQAHEDGRMPGAPHRWSGARGGDHSWYPLRPELVAEVKYQSVLNGRFRATTRFLRWRPDRDPPSCRYEQLDEPTPVPLSAVLEG